MAKTRSFSSLFNLQSKSITVTFGHFSANYQGYILTFWPTIVHFHHFSICNQNQSLSLLVISRQNTKVIALLFGQNRSLSSLFNLQSKSITVTVGHLSANYQCYSLTVWPKVAHFHHFSICSHTQSISNLVILRQNTKAITLLFGHKWLIFITFQSAIKITHCHLCSFFGINTKVIGLLFGQKSLIVITFQSGITVNQFQFWSFIGNNTKVIALLFGQTSLIFITFQSAIKINHCHFWSFVGKLPML